MSVLSPVSSQFQIRLGALERLLSWITLSYKSKKMLTISGGKIHFQDKYGSVDNYRSITGQPSILPIKRVNLDTRPKLKNLDINWLPTFIWWPSDQHWIHCQVHNSMEFIYYYWQINHPENGFDLESCSLLVLGWEAPVFAWKFQDGVSQISESNRCRVFHF